MKKVLLAAASAITGGVVGAAALDKKRKKQIKWQDKRIDKFYGYFQLVNQWLLLKNAGKSLDEYFHKNNYKKIAIYGIGELGNRLYEELKDTDVEIVYAIAKKAEKMNAAVEVVTIEDELKEVDVIVVTPIFMYDELEEMIMEVVDCPVVSLEDVVYSI